MTDAMQNPKKGSVVDWPYRPLTHPGVLMYQNPDVFLQGGAELEASGETDKAPYITEMLNKYRSEFYSLAIGYLHSACVIGDYHEYGCYSASTFRMALTNSALFGLTKHNGSMQFHAFDSFCGLPEISSNLAEESDWVEGSMAMSEVDFLKSLDKHGVYNNRVKTYPGFFNETLTEALQKEFLDQKRSISFANVDCDLYESAVDVLKFIAPLLQPGALLYLDDW
jgi:hypothetical protein